MVKNKGGNKQKRLGRKHLATNQDTKTRFSTSTEEKYACCTKVIGQGYFEVLCIDSKTRLCIARKKFKGRSKRDNLITVGTKLLIGTRDYETTKEGKLEKCDVLEVYREHNYNQIVQHETTYDWSIFNDVGLIDKQDSNTDTNIVFTNEEPLPQISSGNTIIEEDDIDIDDI